ncbi:helix-turn-helix domain containing protein [Micromonospora sp. WMMD1102]|uniref:TetR/AcrR family transcriptional regulator n=1 Tax=Micromonospora sp. WMMD1102 TaxID=3016105 RepID=UPI002414DF58|nr:TetR/AcrR family transcriptional regulator [Micromonospora sp. WMMD1102]MDG4784619.1 helix-turn-helix domain containing protein [Micromonospora sp. WMMD1102]
MRRDAEQNRRRTVQAAREVFAAAGLSATLNDVAHHAGVGVGTVYRRFPDKESLAVEVYAAELAEIRAMAETAAEAPDPFPALAAFLEAALGRAAENRGLLELIGGEVFDVSPFDTVRTDITRAVGRLIRRAQADGTLRRDVTVDDLPAIATMVHALIVTGADWRRFLDVIVAGLRVR